MLVLLSACGHPAASGEVAIVIALAGTSTALVPHSACGKQAHLECGEPPCVALPLPMSAPLDPVCPPACLPACPPALQQGQHAAPHQELGLLAPREAQRQVSRRGKIACQAGCWACTRMCDGLGLQPGGGGGGARLLLEYHTLPSQPSHRLMSATRGHAMHPASVVQSPATPLPWRCRLPV